MIPTRLGRLAVTTHAGRGARALVLWHELFLDARSFAPLLPMLTELGTVIAIDAPGHGASDGPAADYTLHECAGAALEILDVLGLERVDWIGHGWGGSVGIRVERRATRRVRSLAAIATSVGRLPSRERLELAFVEKVLPWLGWRPLLLRSLGRRLTCAAARRRAPGLFDYVADAARRPAVGQMCRAIRSVVLTAPAELDLPSVRAPTLFIAGSRDPVCPPALAEAQAAQIGKNAFHERVSSAAHLPQLENPLGTAEVLRRWLESIG